MRPSITLLFCLIFLYGCHHSGNVAKSTVRTDIPSGKDTVAHRWSDIALTATANDAEKFKKT